MHVLSIHVTCILHLYADTFIDAARVFASLVAPEMERQFFSL